MFKERFLPFPSFAKVGYLTNVHKCRTREKSFGVTELGYFKDFSTDTSEELGNILEDDCLFEIEREIEELTIFDESSNEDFG